MKKKSQFFSIISGFNASPIKIPADIVCVRQQANSKIYMEIQKSLE